MNHFDLLIEHIKNAIAIQAEEFAEQFAIEYDEALNRVSEYIYLALKSDEM